MLQLSPDSCSTGVPDLVSAWPARAGVGQGWPKVNAPRLALDGPTARAGRLQWSGAQSGGFRHDVLSRPTTQAASALRFSFLCSRR